MKCLSKCPNINKLVLIIVFVFIGLPIYAVEYTSTTVTTEYDDQNLAVSRERPGFNPVGMGLKRSSLPIGEVWLNEYKEGDKVLARTYFDAMGRVVCEEILIARLLTDESLGTLKNNPHLLVGKEDAAYNSAKWLKKYYNYNPKTKLLDSVVNFDGGITSYQYDKQQRVNKVTYPDASTVSFTYNNRGQLLTKMDQEGYVVTYRYDAVGKLVSITDPAGVTTKILQNNKGQVVSVQSPLVPPTIQEYDGLGRPTKHVDAFGNSHEMSYNGTEASYQSPLPDAKEVKQKWDPANNVLETYLGSLRVNASYHRFDGSVASVEQSGRNPIRNSVNANGIQVGQSKPLKLNGNPNAEIETVATPRADGRIEMVQGPAGNKVLTVFDEETYEPIAKYTNSNNDDKSSIDPEMQSADYEVLGKDRLGNVVWYRDLKGSEYVNRYDMMGRLVFSRRIKPLGPSVNRTYSLRGQLLSVTRTAVNGDETIHNYRYDALGRNVFQENDGKFIEREYRSDGLLSSVDVDGDITTYDYYPVTNKIRTVQTPTATTYYEYDDFGRRALVSYTPVKSGVTQSTSYEYEYDSNGLLIQTVEFPDGHKERYSYNEHGQIIAREYIDVVGSVIERIEQKYDKGGNHIQTDVYHDGILKAVIEKELRNDANTNVSSGGHGGFTYHTYEKDGSGTILTQAQVESDLIGRSIRQSYLDGQNSAPLQDDVSLTYDEFGRIETVALANGTSHTYSYIANTNLVSSVTGTYPELLSGELVTANITYDGDQRVDRVIFSNGIERGYTYFNDGKLQRMSQTYPAALAGTHTNISGVETFDCFYDANDRLVKVDKTYATINGSQTAESESIYYAYDEHGQLVYEYNTSQTGGYLNRYDYDAYANRTGLATIDESFTDIVVDNDFSTLPKNKNYQSMQAPVYCVLDLTHTADQLSLPEYQTKVTLSGVGGKERSLVLDTRLDGNLNATLTLSSYFDGAQLPEATMTQFAQGRMQLHIISRPNGGNLVWLSGLGERDEMRFDLEESIGQISNITVEPLNNDPGEIVYHSLVIHEVTDTTKFATTVSEYDVGNRLTKKTSQEPGVAPSVLNYFYDQRGHLDEIRNDDGNSLVRSYDYDALGRLKSITGDESVSYDYHAASWMRRRITQGGIVSDYTWANGSVLEVQTQSTRTAYAQVGSAPLWQVAGPGTGVGTAAVYTKNHRGDVTGMYGEFAADHNDKGLLAEYEYDAFGSLRSHRVGIFTPGIQAILSPSTIGAVPPGPSYRGYWFDGGATNLFHTQNRHYDPTLGRFLQLDPARDGQNWYSYAAGDPVNNWDPNGLRVLVKKGDEQAFADWMKTHVTNEFFVNGFGPPAAGVNDEGVGYRRSVPGGGLVGFFGELFMLSEAPDGAGTKLIKTPHLDFSTVPFVELTFNDYQLERVLERGTISQEVLRLGQLIMDDETHVWDRDTQTFRGLTNQERKHQKNAMEHASAVNNLKGVIGPPVASLAEAGDLAFQASLGRGGMGSGSSGGFRHLASKLKAAKFTKFGKLSDDALAKLAVAFEGTKGTLGKKGAELRAMVNLWSRGQHMNKVKAHAPLSIPKNATAIPPTLKPGSGNKYWQYEWRWTDDAGDKISVRWHQPTSASNPPRGAVDNWKIERVRSGSANGSVKKRVWHLVEHENGSGFYWSEAQKQGARWVQPTVDLNDRAHIPYIPIE